MLPSKKVNYQEYKHICFSLSALVREHQSNLVLYSAPKNKIEKEMPEILLLAIPEPSRTSLQQSRVPTS
jgi:hypothetical protein